VNNDTGVNANASDGVDSDADASRLVFVVVSHNGALRSLQHCFAKGIAAQTGGDVHLFGGMRNCHVSILHGHAPPLPSTPSSTSSSLPVSSTLVSDSSTKSWRWTSAHRDWNLDAETLAARLRGNDTGDDGGGGGHDDGAGGGYDILYSAAVL